MRLLRREIFVLRSPWVPEGLFFVAKPRSGSWRQDLDRGFATKKRNPFETQGMLRTERLRKITFYKSNLEKCLLKPVLKFISVVCYREDNGEKYKVGETFTTRNCSETCRCNENGEITCVPLCSKLKCPRGKRPKRRGVINVGEENECSCEIQECVPGTSTCFFYTFK